MYVLKNFVDGGVCYSPKLIAYIYKVPALICLLFGKFDRYDLILAGLAGFDEK